MNYLLDGHETARLRFRLLLPDDFDDWLELFKHPEAAEFLALGHLPTPEARCEYWFRAVFDRYENDRGGLNVLVDKITGQMIGQCGLLVQDVDDVEELEVGYSILPRFWGVGYATEAAQHCKHAAFENNYASSLISLVHVDNIRSKRVAMKNGMTFEKTTNFRGITVDVFRVWNAAKV